MQDNFFKLINNEEVELNHIAQLKDGSGVPFLCNILKENEWNRGFATMKDFGRVIIKYPGYDINDSIYKYCVDDTFTNGFEKFKADIEYFIENDRFRWINNSNETNLELIELMPEFHGIKKKKNIKILSNFIEFNNTIVKVISEEEQYKIVQLLSLFKN
jgi:hypothetical protein